MQPSVDVLSALSSVWREHPRYCGCVGHWFFVEGAGSALYDWSGHGHHGVLNNMDVATDWVSTENGFALDFDRVDDYIRVEPFNEIGAFPFTMSCWVNCPSAGGGYYTFMSLGNGTTNNKYHSIVYNGKSGATGNGTIGSRWNSGFTAASGNPVLENTGWHHIVGVFASDTDKRLYTDGQLAATLTTSRTIDSTVNNVCIGKPGSSSTTADLGIGQMRDARIYNRELTLAEIESLYVQPNLEVEWAEEVVFRQLWTGADVAAPGAFTLTAEQGDYTLTGQIVSFERGHLVAATQGSYALSGQAVVLARGARLGADFGSYSLSGQDVALERALRVTAEQGAYNLLGQSVALTRGLLVGANQGAYALSGQDVSLVYTPTGAFTLSAEQGSYVLTGQAVTLEQGLRVLAAQGSYGLAGQDVNLVYTPAGAFLLTAEQGLYTLAGQAVSLLATNTLAADQGTYSLSGQAAILAQGYLVAAEHGLYVLAGQDVAFTRLYNLLAEQGAYTLAGQAVILLPSGLALQAYKVATVSGPQVAGIVTGPETSQILVES